MPKRDEGKFDMKMGYACLLVKKIQGAHWKGIHSNTWPNTWKFHLFVIYVSCEISLH